MGVFGCVWVCLGVCLLSVSVPHGSGPVPVNVPVSVHVSATRPWHVTVPGPVTVRMHVACRLSPVACRLSPVACCLWQHTRRQTYTHKCARTRTQTQTCKSCNPVVQYLHQLLQRPTKPRHLTGVIPEMSLQTDGIMLVSTSRNDGIYHDERQRFFSFGSSSSSGSEGSEGAAGEAVGQASGRYR